MRAFITALGARVVALMVYIGEIVMLMAETGASIVTQRIRWRLFMQQIRPTSRAVKRTGCG